MKILAIDIETSPAVVYAWGLWDQNVGLNQIVTPVEVICFAAKWIGGSMYFRSTFHDGKEEMLAKAHELLEEADAVIHWNGSRFDIPHLNREFLEAGMSPPAQYHELDLMKTVKRRFKFLSNKLQHVSQQLDLEGKIQHEGFDLWKKCLAGDEAAWVKMRRYNKRDVTLLEDLYETLLPWIIGHPNRRLYKADAGCPRCGAPDDQMQRRGYKTTAVSKFQNLQCQKCQGWSYRTVREDGTKTRSA